MERQPTKAAGRDAVLPPWMRAGREPPVQPRYDSVVVRGNGVGALALVARLARHPAFAGRVTVTSSPVVESRRLIKGLTLRARALDYYGAALERPRSVLLERIFGDRARLAETRQQVTSRCALRPGGDFEIENPGVWMTDAKHDGRVLAYGVRNSRLCASLQDLLAGDVHWHSEPVSSLGECRELALGSRPLVVNASPKPLSDAPLPHAPPRAFVAASQLPFSAPRRRSLGIVPDQASFVAGVRRGRALSVGVYYPLVDPLSPSAEFYGIFYRIVPPGFDRDRELAHVRETVVGVGAAFGLEPVDADETRGEAVVPCAPWRNPPPAPEGLLDLHALYEAGAPIITGDGMVRAGLTGLVAAESVIAGQDPGPHVNRALRTWRMTNRGFAWGMTRLSRLVGPLWRHFPGATLGLLADQPELWAGLE